jgi:hypothetical protein
MRLWNRRDVNTHLGKWNSFDGGKPIRKRPTGRPRRRWKADIKTENIGVCATYINWVIRLRITSGLLWYGNFGCHNSRKFYEKQANYRMRKKETQGSFVNFAKGLHDWNYLDQISCVEKYGLSYECIIAVVTCIVFEDVCFSKCHRPRTSTAHVVK